MVCMYVRVFVCIMCHISCTALRYTIDRNLVLVCYFFLSILYKLFRKQWNMWLEMCIGCSNNNNKINNTYAHSLNVVTYFCCCCCCYVQNFSLKWKCIHFRCLFMNEVPKLIAKCFKYFNMIFVHWQRKQKHKPICCYICALQRRSNLFLFEIVHFSRYNSVLAFLFSHVVALINCLKYIIVFA